MKIVTRSAVALFFALSMAACGGGDDDTTPDAPAGGPDASTGPSVTATPDTDTVAPGGDITLTIAVQNFTLEAPTGQPNVDGHGHYHVYLDDATGLDYLAADAATSVTVTIDAATAVGAHTLKVELFNNDHSPLSPDVSTTIPITVQ